MSAHFKKRKIDTECRVFNETWTSKYLFTEVKGKAVCLVCGEKIVVFKDYNLNRHYETKHGGNYKNLTDEERARTSEALLAKLQKQHGFLTKLSTSRDVAVKTSSVISHKIAKNTKPFSDGEFIKECLVESAALICPEKKEAFENVSLSRRTVTRRIEDITGNLELQLQKKVDDFDFFSLALDESCGMMAAMRSIKGTTTGRDLFTEVNAYLDKLGLKGIQELSLAGRSCICC